MLYCTFDPKKCLLLFLKRFSFLSALFRHIYMFGRFNRIAEGNSCSGCLLSVHSHLAWVVAKPCKCLNGGTSSTWSVVKIWACRTFILYSCQGLLGFNVAISARFIPLKLMFSFLAFHFFITFFSS